MYGKHLFQSVTGVQKGESVGPMGFCQGTLRLMLELKTLFGAYFRDAALAGVPKYVPADFRGFVAAEAEYELGVNVANVSFLS